MIRSKTVSYFAGIVILFSSCTNDVSGPGNDASQLLVVTKQATEIDVTGAKFNCEYINTTDQVITEMGFCWSMSSNPDLTDSYVVVSLRLSAFDTIVTGFLPATTYQVRAFVTTQNATYYGNQVSFSTLPAPAGSCSGGQATVTDADGNIYNVIQIGSQCWMQENLRTTRYNSGDLVITGLNNTGWQNSSLGAWSNVNNDPANDSIFGKLYNWYAVTDFRNLCPVDWHVPSDIEWNELINFLGGDAIAGGKMKSTGNLQGGTGWWSAPNAADNSSGFTGHPSGGRNYDGTYSGFNDNGYWWTTTENQSFDAWDRDLYYGNSFVSRTNYYKQTGFSVRCIKD